MLKKIILILTSLLIVGYGQPAWSELLSILSAVFGFTLFWIALSEIDSNRKRFWVSVAWFSSVQLIQLSWLISHPYIYIWFIYFLVAFLLGLQFALLTRFVERSILNRFNRCLGIAGIWVLLEWSRLFILSGFSWNPVGLALSANVYPLQLASLFGIYGLSFWVLLTNLTWLEAYYKKFENKIVLAALFLTIFPYVTGYLIVKNHDSQMAKNPSHELTALLVQTAFPIEECLNCPLSELKKYVQGEWRQILRSLKGHQKDNLDLIALPEYVVPYGTWTPIFSSREINEMFLDVLGPESLLKMPPLEYPFAHKIEGEWKVSNAYILQGLSNHFHTQVIAGLEDAEEIEPGVVEYYNAARLFQPWNYQNNNRYEKRVLVPMGEYIPFEFCRKLAQSYGVGGSFTCGKEAKIFEGTKAPFGVSICYEETYSHLMRESKVKGAEFLVNLTSDVWYPDSKLAQQHLDHARLRATESGLPLLRACNTGVTCGIDSIGRTVATFGNDEWKQGALKVNLPLYSYFTPFTLYGDHLIIGFSLFTGLFLLLRRKT